MYLRNLLLFLLVLLITPLFGNSAINVLQSGISWVDEKVFNRSIENFESNKTNQDLILLTDDSKTNAQRNIEQKKIAKATDVETLKKIIENSETDNAVKNLQNLNKDQEATNLVAENTNNLSLAAGESDKNVTYMQILQKPNDLELNLKYARQQGKMGNYKQTIATLERLVILYPDNVDLKFYLLSILVKADSPDKVLGLVEEIKLLPDLSSEDLAMVNEMEMNLKDRGEPKLWNFYADLGLGGLFNQNVNSVSKTGTKQSGDDIVGFNTAKFDRVYSGAMGFTLIRSIGEASSMMFNLSGTGSEQDVETTDNFESLGFTFGFDTSIGNHGLSPYLMLNTINYETDATNTSFMTGFANYYAINDAHLLNYAYSYSDSKNNQSPSYTTADDTNVVGHSFSAGYDFTLNETISTSLGLGYADNNAKVDTNDYENFDLDLRLNLSLPFAYVSIGSLLSLVEYSTIDSSINSNLLRSDMTNSSDIMLTKAIGDFFPGIDPERSFFITLSYEKVLSESNLLNYDYIGDSFSIGFNKSIQFNK